jgi:hypothetical protein
MEAIATGNENLGLTVDDEPDRRAMDALGAAEGWAVEHDFLSAHGRHVGTVVRSVRLAPGRDAQPGESRGAAGPSYPAAWLRGEVGGWVTPVLC